MDYLKINFEELRFGGMKATLDSLEKTFLNFQIDFYLIGAFARDMWMNHLDNLPLRRATLDIDFSIYIHESTQFTEMKDHLVAYEGFETTDQPYRLVSSDQTIVDLIPFGGIEKNNVVYLEGHPPMDLSVFGNMQVLAHAENITVGESDFKVCTLPGLCILKLIAANERDERYQKDMGDFFYILENYAEIAGETLFEADYEDLIDEDFEPDVAAAKMLGRQMTPMLNESAELKKTILAILEKHQEKFSDQEIGEMYSLDKRNKKIKRFKLLKCVKSEILN
jgi:predicted nucleotidyltransferase